MPRPRLASIPPTLPRIPFETPVAEAGYHWITAAVPGTPKKQRLLVEVPSVSRAVTFIDPFRSHDGLFRDFGGLGFDEAAIKAFADKFGLLGGTANLLVPAEPQPDGKSALLRPGNTLQQWRDAIARLKICVALYDAARHGDWTLISHHLNFERGRLQFQSHPHTAPGDRDFAQGPHWSQSIAVDDPELVRRLEVGDLVSMARQCIQHNANEVLADETSLRLLWTPDLARQIIRPHIESLLGGLWVQFVHAIEKGSEFRQCSQCGRWFEVAAGAGRVDKVFCSTRCRKRAFRKRHAGERRDQSNVST